MFTFTATTPRSSHSICFAFGLPLELLDELDEEELLLDELEDDELDEEELEVDELLLELLVVLEELLELEVLLLEVLLLEEELLDVLPPQAANSRRATDAGIKERIMVDSRVAYAGFYQNSCKRLPIGKRNGKSFGGG